MHTVLGLCWLPPVKDAKITLVGRNLVIANHTDEERVKLPVCFELDINKGVCVAEQHLILGGSVIQTLD